MPSSIVRAAADRVELLERQADRIHQVVAAGAGRRCSDARPAACAPTRLPSTVLSFSAGTSGSGGGGGTPSRLSSTHLPRMHRRGPRRVRRHRQDAALAQQPAALAVLVERDAAEAAAVDVRNAVVLRQPLVDERVVGAQQIEHAAILAQDAVEEELRLLPERLPQVVVEVREQPHVRRDRRRGCAGAATARRSWSTSARDASSASIRRTCRSSTAGSCSLSGNRHVQQLVVRNAAPQEERQPRRQLEVADAIRRVRRGRRRDPARRGTGTAGSPARPTAPSRCRRRSRPRRGPSDRARAALRRSASVTGRR